MARKRSEADDDFDLDDMDWGLDDEDVEEDDDVDEDDDDAEGDDDSDDAEAVDNEDSDDEDGDGDDDAEADELYKKVSQKLVDELERGDTESGVYKGLQKVIGKKDTEINQLRQQLEANEQFQNEVVEYIKNVRGDVDELSDMSNWASETLMGALNDEYREEAQRKYTERKGSRKAQSEFDSLKAEVERLRKEKEGGQQGAGRGQAQDAPQRDPAIQARIKEFEDDRREAAKRAGIDPDDSRLDYGSQDEGLIERLKKFESSIDAISKTDAKKKKKVDSVRGKGTKPRTRGSGGASASQSDEDFGLSRLDRAAAEIFKEMRS